MCNITFNGFVFGYKLLVLAFSIDSVFNHIFSKFISLFFIIIIRIVVIRKIKGEI